MTGIYRHRALSLHPETQYLDLLEELLRAPSRNTRNDAATRSVFGRQMRFDLARGFPLLTTKKLPFRVIVGELLWFLSGSTNVRRLQEQGIRIWDEWADPESGELGPVYGEQFRFWPSHRKAIAAPTTDNPDQIVHGTIDQIAAVLHSLRKDPYGRRHVVSAWNPADVEDMALPPCHVLFQFYVGADERLSLQMYQRSADTFLGLPFNIASYALLLSMTAYVLGRQPGEFIWAGGDVHLYGNHVDQACEQILRDPRPFPKLRIKPEDCRFDLDHWNIEDFEILDYDPWPHIAAEVSA